MAVRPGGSTSNINDYVAVLLTPKYPLAIEVSITPTAVSGEFDFESKVIRGTPSGTVVWDFGDGSGPVTAGAKIKKRYTKPGTYTAKATVVDSNGSGSTAVSTKTVTISAPTLQIGITVPAFETASIPVGTDFQIIVNVNVANNGVGDIANITFQGGTFTASDSSILSYTTGSTSPFTLAPGTGNSYPLNVRAAAAGTVDVNSLITAKDAAGKDASATTGRTIVVEEAVVTTTTSVTPSAELIGKIDAITALIKQLKAKPSTKEKSAQKEIKSQIKVLAADVVTYLSSNASAIATTNTKIDLKKLAADTRKAVLLAAQVKRTFAADKKAANKSLASLRKAIAP